MELRVNCYEIYFVPVDNVDTVLRNLFDHSLNCKIAADSSHICSHHVILVSYDQIFGLLTSDIQPGKGTQPGGEAGL